MLETTHYLLIGGYAAGCAARSIRERDTSHRLVLVCGEQHPPYDRPPLSKELLFDDEFDSATVRSQSDSFYADNNIELRTGVNVARIDRAQHTVYFESGDTLIYEKLLLASGSLVKRLDVPGSELQGIFYLRTLADSVAIRDAFRRAQDQKLPVVVIGSSYLGMEAASGCARRGVQVTVVERGDKGPWGKFSSPALSQFVRKEYEKWGVEFVFDEQIAAFEGDSELTAVRLKSGKQLPAGAVVAAVGVTLNTHLAQEAGLEIDDTHGIVVNEQLQTADERIWSAGDVACFPDVALGKRWHAEHYLNAKWQGECAGANMAASKGENYDRLAYFFSDFLDLHMVLRGDPQAGDRKNTRVLGEMASGEFVELYADKLGHLRMGIGMSHDEEKLNSVSEMLEEMIRAGTNAHEVQLGSFPTLFG